jgi:acyl-coenzyme A synthetase/AMP-(fatty) acid ligase/acyl carrier protein
LCLFDLAHQGLAAFREWIEQERITLLHPPVLLFRRFLATLEGENLFPSVRQVALAGDMVLTADVEKWKRHFARSCSLQHRFSTTETALLAVAHIGPDTAPEEYVGGPGVVAAGCPVADKCLELVDDEGRAVASGQTGRLLVTSSFLAEGYWRRPGETNTAFKPDPDRPERRTYQTGDRGRFLSDGRFVFEGRRDHQVKIRGYRVDTREVEAALLLLNEVAEAATVVRRQDDEQRLVAFVVLKPGSPSGPVTLRERLRAYLPEWKMPASIFSIPSLPTTLTGKVDRQRLQDELRAPLVLESCPAAEEQATLEEELAEIWRSTLRLDAVGPDDRFLDLGGDSISALMTLNWIEKCYGIRLVPAELLGNATVRQLAERIRNA